MTLDDADELLGQWAVWSKNELAKLGAAKSSWQMDYRTDWSEESAQSHIIPGDDLTMLDVDTALAMLRVTDQPRFFMLRNRYRYGTAYTAFELDTAKRAFILEYQSPLNGANDETTILGRALNGKA